MMFSFREDLVFFWKAFRVKAVRFLRWFSLCSSLLRTKLFLVLHMFLDHSPQGECLADFLLYGVS